MIGYAKQYKGSCTRSQVYIFHVFASAAACGYDCLEGVLDSPAESGTSNRRPGNIMFVVRAYTPGAQDRDPGRTQEVLVRLVRL